MEIYQIMGTAFWLFLFQLFKFPQLQRIASKISSKTFSIWLNLSLWIRIILLFSLLVGMIWNDYFRIAICSYLSAVSINQYQTYQQPVIHYSSQSIITTGYPDELQQQNEILPLRAPPPTPTAVSVDMKRSSDFTSLRHRRGSSRSESRHSILPTHVAQPSPSFQKKDSNSDRDRLSRQPVRFVILFLYIWFLLEIPQAAPASFAKQAEEIWDRSANSSSAAESLEAPVSTSTKRKLDDVETEHGSRNHDDEVPTKKRDIASSNSENGLIYGLISRLPNWRSMFSQPQELLPTKAISSHSSPVDIDSKKRQRSEESAEADSHKMFIGEETADDSEEDLVGVRKIPRRTEKSLSVFRENEPEQKPEPESVFLAPDSERESIYLSKPHISLRPPQLANHSSQLLLEQPKESPQQSHHRPVLRSRHAVDTLDLISSLTPSHPLLSLL
jgi:hypothetical protein